MKDEIVLYQPDEQAQQVSAFFAHTNQLSKKWFSFSKLEKKSVEGIIHEIRDLI